MPEGLLSAYVALGTNELKRQLTIERLKRRLGDASLLAFNLREFDAGQAFDVSELASALNQWSFDETPRAVFIYNAEQLNSDAREAITNYLDNPTPDMVCLLIANKLDKRTAFYKRLVAVGKSAIINCEQPQEKELPALALRLARSYGINLLGPAAQELVNRVGNDTLQLDNQVRQLARLVGLPGEAGEFAGFIPIEIEFVRQHVKRTAESKPWPLLDAVCARDFAQASEQLAHFDLTSDAFRLQILILRRLRELICVKSYAERGQLMQAAAELNKQDWLINKYAAWARMWTPSELEAALVSACECERMHKSSGDIETAFMRWIVSMCSAQS